MLPPQVSTTTTHQIYDEIMYLYQELFTGMIPAMNGTLIFCRTSGWPWTSGGSSRPSANGIDCCAALYSIAWVVIFA
jgi:hypothetical protein